MQRSGFGAAFEGSCGSWGRWAAGLLLGVSLGAGAACNQSATGPGLRLRLAGTPLGQGCLQPSTMQPVDAMALLQSGSVHVTAVRRDADGPHLLCDATAKVPSETLSLDIGEGDRASIDYYAEFFDATGAKVASGSLLASSADASASSDTPTLHMFAASSWSCPPAKLNHARAFHSATMLPNGEVLLLGGIEALGGYGVDVFGVVDTAEIYDPRKATFTLLTAATGTLAARAFHNIGLLDASGSTVRLVVYGGVTAPVGQPALFVPDSPTQLRLMPGGSAEPGSSQLLVYDTLQHTLTATPLDTTHKAAFAAGAELPGGGLLAVGGASFNKTLPFGRSNPAMFTAVSDAVAIASPGASAAPAPVFATGGSSASWLLGATATPLSTTTALVLGAKLPPDSMIKMQALAMQSLPAGLQVPASQAVAGPSTVFHTATRIGTSISASTPNGDTQILVTGGFVQDSAPPYATRQPPDPASAVRLYTVSDSAGTLSPIGFTSLTPYNPTGCGTADGHYRPAGFEAATATQSGKQVLITGGTPQVLTSGCVDCEATDTASNKLLCVLRQASLFDSATQTVVAAPNMPLGRMGHGQTRLSDGNILITGGLVRPSGGMTQSTAEAEIYNPVSLNGGTSDPNDPLATLRASGAPPACSRL